jgi:hypothetical protein
VSCNPVRSLTESARCPQTKTIATVASVSLFAFAKTIHKKAVFFFFKECLSGSYYAVCGDDGVMQKEKTVT